MKNVLTNVLDVRLLLLICVLNAVKIDQFLHSVHVTMDSLRKRILALPVERNVRLVEEPKIV